MEPIYSPFQKPIGDLSPDDLAVLQTVHEGWHVEYKELVPNPQSIAKSISAFANTFGGFLFYGVREKSKQENVAGSFPGVLTADLDKECARIRQAICAYSAPEPFFETKVFRGPCEGLGLPADRSVICIHVPQSSRAPHIHRSGIIYRRVADSSEPTAENDRHALGELFKRSDKLIKMFQSWFDDDPSFTQAEKLQPYLRLLVSFDPWRERLPRLNLTTSQIRKVFNPEDRRATLPFDSIFPTVNGYVARQTAENDLTSLSLTWALRWDLSGEILIPIPRIHIEGKEACKEDFAGYEYAEAFVQVLSQRKYAQLSVLDLNQLYIVLLGVFETMDRLADAANWRHGSSANFKVLNANRACPFLDIASIVEQYKTHGVPIALSFMSALRESHHPESFLRFDARSENGAKIDPSVHAAVLVVYVARSLGIPIWEDPDPESDDESILEQLRMAGVRSMRAQSLRNQRRQD